MRRKIRRHRWQWRIAAARPRPLQWGSGRWGYAKETAPRTAMVRRHALARCVHCGTLARWEPIGDRGGLVRQYNLPGDPLMWMDEPPICARKA